MYHAIKLMLKKGNDSKNNHNNNNSNNNTTGIYYLPLFSNQDKDVCTVYGRRNAKNKNRDISLTFRIYTYMNK